MPQRSMKDWNREEWLKYARANLRRREYIKRMKEANFTEWNERDLANLLCIETTGHPLDVIPESTTLDKPEPEPEPIPELPPLPELPKEAAQVSSDDTEVERLYKEYLDRFEMPEPNDRFMVRQLCRLQVALERATTNYMSLLGVDGVAQNQLKYASDPIQTLTEKVISLQKALGIDKLGRGVEEDSGDRLLDYSTQARHILHRQGIPLICVNCARGEDKIINQFGFIVWHFQFDAEWQFEFTCPRCGQKMTYNKGNVTDLKKLAGWNK